MTNKDRKTIYPKAFLKGFMLDNTKAVIETYEKLKNNGIAAGQEPRKIRDSFGFYFNFVTVMIEAGHHLT